MPRKYTPTRKTQPCPHGCGTYTVNGDGRMRRHGIDSCERGCERACDGTTQTPAVTPTLAREAPLTDAQVYALLYFGAPAVVRHRCEAPHPRTTESLMVRGYMMPALSGITPQLATRGRKAVITLDKLPATLPRVLRDYWSAVHMMTPDVPVLPTLNELVEQIDRYRSRPKPVAALADIRAVLEVLYRESGRT